MRPTFSPLLGLIAAVICLPACDDFLAFDELRCGNGVIEPAADEDCDGLPGGSRFRCGPPGTAAACRLVCGDGVGCPEGWACGADGVCSAAAQRFEPPVVTRLDGESVALGDLDGDGRLDVVTNQRQALGLAYGRGDGAFDVVESVAVSIASLEPAVGDADGDGRDDVALLSGDGLEILRGTESRTLEAVVAPLDVPVTPDGVSAEATPNAIVGVRATPPFNSAEALYLFRTPEGVRFSVLGKALDSAAVEAELAGLARPVMRAVDLDGGEAPAADGLLLTFGGHATVYALEMHCDAETCGLSIRARLPINGGMASTAGAFAGDLNLDGWPDVMAQPDGLSAMQVAWGSADGWQALRSIPGFGVGPGRREGGPSTVHAVGDVGGDARPDLVAEGAVLATSGALDAPRSNRIFVPRRPTRATGVADLDGDGAADVYGLVGASLEFALARDDGLFVELASGVTDVEAVVHGDVDGDRYTDLIAWQVDGQVQVLFGGTGGFTRPATIGRFSGPLAMALAPLAVGMSLDATDDLILSADGVHYRFAGSPQRHVAAPISHPDRPQGVAIGRFDGGTVFVAGRTTMLDRADSLLPTDALAGADPRLVPLATEGCRPDARAASAFLRVLDLDGDGLDEVVHVDRTQLDGDLVDAVQVIEVGVDGARCREVGLLDSARAVRLVTRADLDGDGADDLVVMLYSPGVPGAGGADDEWIIWPSARASAEPLRFDAAGVEHAAGLSLGGRRRLVAVIGGQLQQGAVRDGALVFEPLGAGPHGVFDSRAGDVDGDGLDDLVLKTSASVLVYRQATCGARAAWDGTCIRREAW